MLSSEGSTLSRLILARHTLICRTVEIDLELEVLTLVESAHSASEYPDGLTPPRQSFSHTRKELCAERTLLPALISNLEFEIERAWQRLYSVSP